MANILNSPGRYVQGAGELSKLGKYAEGYGKKALILISQSGYKRIGGRVETGFEETGCSTVFDYFNGECCKTEINRLIGVMEKEVWLSVSAAVRFWILPRQWLITGILPW